VGGGGEIKRETQRESRRARGRERQRNIQSESDGARERERERGPELEQDKERGTNSFSPALEALILLVFRKLEGEVGGWGRVPFPRI